VHSAFRRDAVEHDIEAYESVPEVWAGEHWAWAMHGIGFGRVHDIRFVEPTVQDRIRVLDLVDEIIRTRR
jgi:hypothetical protein